MDNDLERNVDESRDGKGSSQVEMEQRIKEHLRKLDEIAAREAVGAKVIDATMKDGSPRGRVRCGLEGEDDWMIGC